MDDATMMTLYQHLTTRRAAGPTAVKDLPETERLAYHAEANRKSRAKAKAARESGALQPTDATIRTVLADAAIMILATDGPGAEQVRNALAKAYPGMPGLPLTVGQRARSGALRPKLLEVPGTDLKSS